MPPKKRITEAMTSELDMIIWCLSFIIYKKRKQDHKNIANIIWEFGRYQKCSRGSCIIGKAHLHEEAINRGWRLYRPSGKVVIVCGAHPIPRITLMSRKNYCSSCHVYYSRNSRHQDLKCVLCHEWLIINQREIQF